MKKMMLFVAIVFAMITVAAQQSSNVYPLNPSSTISVQECIDLMNAAQTKVEKTTNLKKKVEKTVAEVKKGEKTPEAGAKEITQEVADAPKEVLVETKKAANNVARKVLYHEDLKDAMQAFEKIVNSDIAKINEEIASLKEEINKLKENDAKQDERLGNGETVVADHENRINNLEEGIVGGYFGAGFKTSSLFKTAGYGTVGTTIKIGSLKKGGKFKADFGLSLFGSEKKNLMGFEGRGLVQWASEDFKYLNIKFGGAGGAMADVNNAGKIANAYGGGLIELEAVFKEHYGIAASILLGASDSQKINGAHKTEFLWSLSVDLRYHF